MAIEILMLICCICCFCSCILACALIYPPPAETPSSLPEFKQVASGRVVYEPDKTPLPNNLADCATSCKMDWTCKAFDHWTEKDNFGFVSGKCIRHSFNVNPWMTLPGYLVGKPTSNIFVKIS